MRAVKLFPIFAIACGSANRPPPTVPPLEVPKGGEPSPCIVVHDEPTGIETPFEGTLARVKDAFVLRLDRPRCVVGLEGASVLVEVGLVSTGFDLRPLVGRKVRATGEPSASDTDLGGPGVVVIASQIEHVALP